MDSFSTQIATLINVFDWQVKNAIELLDSGATIPFIARYRKEKTGELTDEQLIEIQKLNDRFILLEERRTFVLKTLTELNVLTNELKNSILQSTTMSEIEDIYLPYKPKRLTRAVKARNKGLEPLAKMIMSEKVTNPEEVALKFVSSKHNVANTTEALSGARDIIAEWVSEYTWVRQRLRIIFDNESTITSKVAKSKEEAGEKYKDWFNWSENAKKSPPHRILAMYRGEKEGFLKIKVEPDKETAINFITSRLIKTNNESAEQKKQAITDAVKRILFPSLETEIRASLKEKADEASIKMFTNNLQQLLLSSPLGQKTILAIDPGFKTGCKIVCLNKNGDLLHNDTIYPHPPQRDSKLAIKKINNLVDAYNIEAIAVGNGTAGRETEELIERIKFKRDVIAVSVNEDGASVYSASKVARDEFPEYDITVRGAVSIGRRLQDPLSELVKIEPKSIGVGQYQHDVNQKMLKQSLQATVELCVNKVGVDLNLASKELLTFISGLGPKLAAQIVEYRKQNGDFKNRNELLKVSGLGKKAYEQAAGFLRIKNGENILDSTAVHPEHYKTVEYIAKKRKVELNKLIGDKNLKTILNLDDFVTKDVGLITLQDILKELEKPGRDPRKKFKLFQFSSNINHISDIKPGAVLPGTVTNLTAFGAFINLGIHESALLHKSQIANKFVSNPAEYLRINQQIMVKVLDVDVARKRISLSMKDVPQS